MPKDYSKALAALGDDPRNPKKKARPRKDYSSALTTMNVAALGEQMAATGKSVVEGVARSASGKSAAKPATPKPKKAPPVDRARLAADLRSAYKDESTAQGMGARLNAVARAYGLPEKAKPDGPSVEGLLANLGGDALDVVTGLPNAAVLVAKNAALAPTGLYGHTVGRVLPGGQPARDFAAGVIEDDKAAGKAIAADYSHRYGPLFSGDFGTFASRMYENPGFFALDAGTVVTAAGSGAAAAARGLAKTAPASAFGQKAAKFGSRSIAPGGPRYREPKVLTQRVGEASPESISIEVPRRPYTPNPLTRPLQRGVDVLRERASEAVGRYGEDLRGTSGLQGAAGAIARRVGPEGQFQRAAYRQARDIKLGAQDEAARMTADIASDYLRARSGLSSAIGRDLVGRKHEEAALYLHMKGLLDVPGLTPRQARDRVIKTMRAEQDLRPTIKKANSLRVIQSFEDIPESLLDLKTAPPALRQAVASGRALSEKATGFTVASGKITPETAESVAMRPGEVIHAGSRFDKKTGMFSPADPYTKTGRGVYLPDIPVDKLTRTAAKAAGQFGRFTAEPIKQSHGFLLLTGNLVTDSRLPVYAAQKAVAASLQPKFIDDFVQRFAAREGGPKGKIVSGPRAVEALRADPDNIVLISRRAILDGLNAANDLPAGKFLTDEDLSGAFIGGAQLRTVEELARSGKALDVIAVPKSAADTIRSGMVAPTRLVRGLDNALDAWRSGILAFAPRWYVNNLFGNTLQFGLLGGLDLKAIRQAARPEFRHAIPERIAASTLARDARGNLTGKMGREQGRLSAAAETGFAFNQWLEAHIRRGAYVAAAKKVLRNEGTKTRRMSDADLARVIEDMPDALKTEAIRKTELFMGDYRRLSPFERNVLRRVFPFYSWIRVIGKLTASLPFEHPMRTQAMALASKMGTEVENPLDQIRPYWERGRINLPGGISLRTTGANPFATVAGTVAALGTGDVGGAVNELATGSFNPLIQVAGAQVAGRNLFTGRDFSAPPGWEGTLSQFGRDPVRWNAATGRFDSVQIKPSLATNLLESLPMVSNIRALVSQGRSPYDVVPTTDLVLGRRPNWQMYRRPPRSSTGVERIPTVTALGGLIGFPAVRVDPEAELRAYIENIRRGEAMRRATEKSARRATGG